MADVYDLPIVTMQSGEGPALGAAILAGVAAKVYSSVEEGCDRTVRQASCVTSDPTAHEEYMKLYAIYQGLYPALKESFGALSEL